MSAEGDMPASYAGDSLELRIAQVENSLDEPPRSASEIDDDDILTFVRVRRALYVEIFSRLRICTRVCYRVCRTP